MLVKAKRLSPHLRERVDARFDVTHRTIEREDLRRKLRAVEGEALVNVIAPETFENVHGQEEPCLHDEEHAYLGIPTGSLNERERKGIESHGTRTYNFLTQIPWTGS